MLWQSLRKYKRQPKLSFVIRREKGLVLYDEPKSRLGAYQLPIANIKISLDLDRKKNRILELERKMEEPHFWDDPQKAQEETKILSDLKKDFEQVQLLEELYEEIELLIQMGIEEKDESLLEEVLEKLSLLESSYQVLKMATLLSGEYDHSDAILTIHAGAGGTESCDWADMLYRMYSRWANAYGAKVEVLDFLDGEEAGIKSVTMEIKGENAYGYLKGEQGVHRLVRISPFNAAGKRMTSFVSVDVMPDIHEEINIQINEDDLKIDTYRASGAGGQHVNKTSSAIRITHLPTGIVVQCQNERSQHSNKDKAMQMLKAKLYILKEEEQKAKSEDIRGEVKDISWGNQIRSYVLQPYTMVKDLRTLEETSNTQAVLDGKIDNFMYAYLTWLATGQTVKK